MLAVGRALRPVAAVVTLPAQHGLTDLVAVLRPTVQMRLRHNDEGTLELYIICMSSACHFGQSRYQNYVNIFISGEMGFLWTLFALEEGLQPATATGRRAQWSTFRG